MMITFGYLRLGISFLLILGWAIFVQNLCIPKSLLTHTLVNSSTLLTVVSPITVTSRTISYSVITDVKTVPIDTLVTIATTTAVTVVSPMTLTSHSVSASTWTVGSNSTLTSSWAVASPSIQSSTLASASTSLVTASPQAPSTHSSALTTHAGAPSSSSLIPGATPGSTTRTQPSTSTSSISSPSGGTQPMDGAVEGEASFYTSWNDHKGSCGFIPSDPYIAAANPQFMPAKCNQCALVSYQGKQIKVKITDTCPECPANKLDLSDFAFKQLADPIKGIIKIQWKWVNC